MRPESTCLPNKIVPFRPLSDRPGSHRRLSKAADSVERGTEEAGSSGFFAVDHRAWRAVCRLGLNEAICYLALARGSLADNRNTAWSINAVEHRTGISRKRLKAPMLALETSGLARRTNASEKFPRRFLVPGHEIGIRLSGLPELTAEEQALWDQLPINTKPKLPENVLATARALKAKKYARSRGSLIEANPDLLASADERPDWVWLPNTLIDPIQGRASPIEQIRQSQDIALLRLFIDLYHDHSLSFDGGVPSKLLVKTYKRFKVVDDGPLTGWRFEHDSYQSDGDAAFYAAFVADSPAGGNERFFEAIEELRNLGLITFVEHLFEGDGEEAEVIHPFAKPLPGRDVTEAEGELYEAAARAGETMARGIQLEEGQAVVPVPSHIKKVMMRGVCRLRHRPHTTVTAEWMKQSDHWREQAAYFNAYTQSRIVKAA